MTNKKKHQIATYVNIGAKAVLIGDVAVLFLANLSPKIFLPILFASGLLIIGAEIAETYFYNRINNNNLSR